jgi:hypothetical protein
LKLTLADVVAAIAGYPLYRGRRFSVNPNPAPAAPPPHIQTRPHPLTPQLLSWRVNADGHLEAESLVADDGIPRLFVIELRPAHIRLAGTPELCGDDGWEHLTDSLAAAKAEAEDIERRNRRALAADAGWGRA